MARKSLRDEVIQAKVINLSWTTILRALHSTKLDEKEKRTIALEIVKKSVPQKHDHTGKFIIEMTQEEKLERSSRLKEYFGAN